MKILRALSWMNGKGCCFNSSKAETNQEVTKRVMEAIVADHMGTEKCPWSAAEMKGMNKELELFAGL